MISIDKNEWKTAIGFQKATVVLPDKKYPQGFYCSNSCGFYFCMVYQSICILQFLKYEAVLSIINCVYRLSSGSFKMNNGFPSEKIQIY